MGKSSVNLHTNSNLPHLDEPVGSSLLTIRCATPKLTALLTSDTKLFLFPFSDI